MTTGSGPVDVHDARSSGVSAGSSVLGIMRRAIAGWILILLGVWLFTATTGSAAGSAIVGSILLASWWGAGVGVLAGRPTGRLAGLAAAAIGILVGLSLGLGGIDTPITPWLFSTADAIRWYVVQPVGYIVAVVSALAGFLIIEPFGPATPPPTPPSDVEDPDD